MKNLIIGDVHGHFKNLRNMLLEYGAINEDNKRINRDELGVYCTGDLVDGGVNRTGDILILEYVRDWFDKVIVGNHELPFFGGPSFMGIRSHDRELTRKLLQLEYEGKYVPSTVVDDYLLVHGGLAKRWGFKSASDANDVIHMMWNQSAETTKEIPMIDWISEARTARKFADETGGVVWLDWEDERNTLINQIVGHSTYTNGPLVIHNDTGTEHWNIDVGGKYGMCLGGVMLEEGQPALPVFWGERVRLTQKYSVLSSDADWLNDPVEDGEWEEVETIDLDDPDNFEEYRQLMEAH